MEVYSAAQKRWLEVSSVSNFESFQACLLYTSDAADERSSVDLGGRRIIKKKQKGMTEHDDVAQDKHNRTSK